MSSREFIGRSALAAAIALGLAGPALAHHGFGRFEMDTDVRYSGTLTGIDLVNPHSYMNFDVVGPETPFERHPCEELTYEFAPQQGSAER